MGYFAGTGAGKGWISKSYFVEPGLLAQALRDHGAWIHPTDKMPTELVGTDGIDSFCHRYDEVIQKAFAGTLGHFYLHSHIFPPSFDVHLEPSKLPGFTTRRLREPAISLRDELLAVDKRSGRLQTNSSPGIFIGLRIAIPKVWFDYSEGRSGEECDGAELICRPLFDSLTSSLQSQTKPLKVETPLGTRTTRIRVCPAMKRRLPEHPGFAQLGLRFLP
jgi:hypothetical protein